MDYSELMQPQSRQSLFVPYFTIRVAENGVMVETVANGQRTMVYPTFEEASEYIQGVIDSYREANAQAQKEAAEQAKARANNSNTEVRG
jgi:hypothetical protein